MKLSILTTLAAFLVASQGHPIYKRPNLHDAARVARTLVSRESLVNINSVFQTGDNEGLPVSFVEYYADCGDGNPVILAVNIGSSFQNIKNGSPYSLTIRTGDHSFEEEVDRKYPGGRPNSVAGSPRINLRGEFINIYDDKNNHEEYKALEKCFTDRHEDATWWLPGNPIHSSHFVKFIVKDAYFVGGFGDIGYIGNIPSKDYHEAKLLEADSEPQAPEEEQETKEPEPEQEQEQEQEQEVEEQKHDPKFYDLVKDPHNGQYVLKEAEEEKALPFHDIPEHKYSTKPHYGQVFNEEDDEEPHHKSEEDPHHGQKFHKGRKPHHKQEDDPHHGKFSRKGRKPHHKSGKGPHHGKSFPKGGPKPHHRLLEDPHHGKYFKQEKQQDHHEGGGFAEKIAKFRDNIKYILVDKLEHM